MRGRQLTDPLAPDDRRNTPAYAGKTTGRGKRAKYDKKHPRVCGEDPVQQ